MNKTIDQTLQRVTELLASVSKNEELMGLRGNNVMPSVEALNELMLQVRSVVFPGFFDRSATTERMRPYRIGVDVERIFCSLARQVAFAVAFGCEQDEATSRSMGQRLAQQFVDQLPEIRRLLLTDVAAIKANDPAVTSAGEVVYSYPVVQVMLHYRTAHALHELGVPLIPRIITELAHSATGIDIHPAAQIGEYFAIDHGTGVVIGATSIIGNHVTLYQGVTLGAKNFQHDEQGQLLDVPRHPIIEDNVVVYSNASILGRITIGHNSVIGGNVWLDHSVPPHSRIRQGKINSQPGFTDGAGI